MRLEPLFKYCQDMLYHTMLQKVQATSPQRCWQCRPRQRMQDLAALSGRDRCASTARPVQHHHVTALRTPPRCCRQRAPAPAHHARHVQVILGDTFSDAKNFPPFAAPLTAKPARPGWEEVQRKPHSEGRLLAPSQLAANAPRLVSVGFLHGVIALFFRGQAAST